MEDLSPYCNVKSLAKDTLCKDARACDSTQSLKVRALVVRSFNMRDGVYAVHRHCCPAGEVFSVPLDHLVALTEAEISELKAPPAPKGGKKPPAAAPAPAPPTRKTAPAPAPPTGKAAAPVPVPAPPAGKTAVPAPPTGKSAPLKRKAADGPLEDFPSGALCKDIRGFVLTKSLKSQALVVRKVTGTGLVTVHHFGSPAGAVSAVPKEHLTLLSEAEIAQVRKA